MSNKEETVVLNPPGRYKEEPNGLIHVKEKNWGALLIVIGVCTTVGASVPVGYNIGVINAPAEYMKSWCNETIVLRYNTYLTDNLLKVLWSSVISICLIGGAVGSLGGAWVNDRLGRKGSFMSCCVMFVIAAICFQFCRAFDSIEMLIIGRLIVGLASGLTTTTVPMYLTEIAPLELRGTLGVLCSMGVTGGVVVGQIVSLQEIFGTEQLWHYALSAYVVLILICIVPYPWYPESPKYLYVIANRKDDALNELRRLRNNDSDIINNEIRAMEHTIGRIHEKRSVWSVLMDPTLLLPIIIVCAMQGGQQLSGINAVFYYSVSIFQAAGLSPTAAKWANLGAGCINLFIAFFSPILMKKVNRRPLAILSCSMSGLFLYILVFIVYFIDYSPFFPIACIIAIFGYIMFYQLGLGPIPYFIGSELFEVGPRPAAMALGSLSSWTCNFIIGMSFPTLQYFWGSFVFLPFAFVCTSLTLLVKFYLPETRGKDVSEITPLIANGFQSRPTVPIL